MENMDRIVHKIVLRIASMGYVRMSTDHVTVRKKIMDTLNVINTVQLGCMVKIAVLSAARVVKTKHAREKTDTVP